MKTKSIYEKLAIFLAILGFGAEMGAGCANKVAFNSLPQGAANSVSSTPGSGGSGGSGGGGGVGSGGGTSGSGGGCTLENLERPVKIMFVVDTSGSNNSPSMDDGTEACTMTAGCSPATDPQKTFRSGSITTFFNTYQNKTNFSWGFETFSGTTAQPYITTSNGLASFGNSTAMQSAITDFNNETDGDATPYLAALKNVQTAIVGDPDLNSVSPTPLYFVIFLSDGYPTDALSSTNPVTVDLNALDEAVSGIVALAPGRVTLSSAYYGTINDPNAAATLQSMATTGQGQFVNVDTGSTSSIVINDLITVPVGQCQ